MGREEASIINILQYGFIFITYIDKGKIKKEKKKKSFLRLGNKNILDP